MVVVNRVRWRERGGSNPRRHGCRDKVAVVARGNRGPTVVGDSKKGMGLAAVMPCSS